MTTVTADAVRSGPRLRAVATALVVLALILGAAVAIVDHLREPTVAAATTYSSTDLEAMTDLQLATGFERVRSAWACIGTAQSACFTTSLSGVAAAQAVASAVGAKEYSTVLGRGGNPARFSMCTTVGDAPASVQVSARPVNAVEQPNGLWVVPPGQEGRSSGSTVTISLTGPDGCPGGA